MKRVYDHFLENYIIHTENVNNTIHNNNHFTFANCWALSCIDALLVTIHFVKRILIRLPIVNDLIKVLQNVSSLYVIKNRYEKPYTTLNDNGHKSKQNQIIFCIQP